MSAELIINKIISDAGIEVAEIEKKTQGEIDVIKKEFEAKENEATLAISSAAEKRIQEMSSKSEMFFVMKEKADILQAKQQKAKEFKKKIVENLQKLEDSEYKKILKNSLKFAQGEKEGVLSVPVHKKKVFESVLKDSHSNIAVKEDEKIKDGFVFSSEKFSVTFSFDEFADEYLSANLNKVLNIIFK